MNYRFTDLVDIDAFRGMLKSFYQATGILHGLVDEDNNVISAVGWQKACTDFHRANPCTNTRCLESNRYLSEHLAEGAFVGNACENGLIDYATPIVIEGKQLATLYFGQLFHEAPDMEFFRRQAQECGFDEESYLEAIRQVPVVPKERIRPIMDFYVQLAQMLARSGLDRMRERETERKLDDLNRELVQRIGERTAELMTNNSRLTSEIEERLRTEAALRDSRAHLQAILDSAPIGIGWSDLNGKVEYINNKFTELFGYCMDDIPTVEHWYKLAYPDENFRHEVVYKWVEEVTAARDAGTEAPRLEAAIVCKDGAVRHVIIAVSWVGQHRLVNFSDITDRWRAERRDHGREEVLELIATGATLQQIMQAMVENVEAEDKSMICSILLLDDEGRRLRCGAAPNLPDFYNRAIDGIEIGEGVGSCGTAAFRMERVIVADINSHPYWENFKELAARAGVGACWSEPLVSSKGRLLGTFAIYYRQPHQPDDEILQLISSAANLASIAIEHYQADQELERQAHTDFLTGVANRRYFMELAESELTRALRYPEPFSLLMLDIDHFKAVNDSHGHKTGDRVLQRFAAILRETLREVDTVGRLGGEEFAAILPNTGMAEAWDAAERLRLAVSAAEMQSDAGLTLHITISVGVATLFNENSIDTLMKRADDALYLAKNNGRNQVWLSEEKPLSGPKQSKLQGF